MWARQSEELKTYCGVRCTVSAKIFSSSPLCLAAIPVWNAEVVSLSVLMQYDPAEAQCLSGETSDITFRSCAVKVCGASL
ncbi:hypothetical protein GXW82_38025 [Streptacidiphilus sp. 4-A2]|nr:hypothetical protein [Streptacidiphilus sp. 4-A2]